MEEVFSVVGKAGDKESLPARVRVSISLVNDQLPVVINNTMLRLWRGGSQIVTPSHLGKNNRLIKYFLCFWVVQKVSAGMVKWVEFSSVMGIVKFQFV